VPMKTASRKVKSLKKAVTKKRTQKRQTSTASTPPANGNPFRAESSYFRIFNALASAPEGLTREDLLKRAMKVTRKDKKHAGFDLAVILSAKDSPTGKRHPCCREGFWIDRDGDLLKLRTA